MFNRKLQLRVLSVMSLYVVSTALPTSRSEAADDDMAGTHGDLHD